MEGHLKEQDIELLVLTPEKLRCDLKQRMEAHLSECVHCKEISTFLRAFYSEFENASPSKDHRVEELLMRLQNREQVFDLVPYRFMPDPFEYGERAMTVLAAKSEIRNHYRYSEVCTLVSKDENALVKILKDGESTSYKLFLVTSDLLPGTQATIRFPLLGLSKTLTFDLPRVDFELPANIPEVDWTTIVAELRFSQQ